MVLAIWLVLGLFWVLWGQPQHGRLMTGLAAIRALCDLRGTKIDLRGSDTNLYMHFV